MRKSKWVIVTLVGTVVLWIYIAHRTLSVEPEAVDESSEQAELRSRILELEKQLQIETEMLQRLGREAKAAKVREERRATDHDDSQGWPEPIPILVFACNRESAVRNHVNLLLRYRQSKQRFPVVVSQDCDDEHTARAIKEFGDDVIYLKHVSGDKANLTIPPYHQRWTTYYKISRHYKLALSHVFDTLGYTSVIITEDDLDIAPDFFEYFSATRHLLEEDPSLYCVSAWNDNGKPNLIDPEAQSLLYRSDFFSGLGWMMTRQLWQEFGPIWPAGFWDDWVREPEQRRNRSCIRPEISRTAMTLQGKKGASEGLFFTKHLVKVQLNRKPVEFSRKNLDYLKKDNYDKMFDDIVFEKSRPVNIDDVFRAPKEGSVRVYYHGNIDYIKKADKLQIMHDFKAGVPRTAYKGVVSAFVGGLRVYLVPNTTLIHGYDKRWEVPVGMD